MQAETTAAAMPLDASPTQIENYLQLSAVGATSSPEPVNGWQWSNVQYSNMRFVSVLDLDNGVMFFVQKSDLEIEVPRSGHFQIGR